MADPKDKKQRVEGEEIDPLEEESELEAIDGGEEEEEDREGEADEEEEESGDDSDEEEESLTVEELQERLTKVESERDGFRRDLFRTRERNRLARTRETMAHMYEPAREEGDERGEEGADDRIEVEMDEEGKLTIPRKALLKQTAAATTPRHQPQRTSAAQAIAQASQNYQRQRATIIDEAEDPMAASDTLDELEMAYGFLDRMVGSVVQEVGVLPQGEDSLRDLITSEGLDRRFSRRFPGVDWKDLIRAPNDPQVLRKLVQGQQGKTSRRRADEGEEREERTERVLRAGNRPRSMKRRRRKAKPKVSGKTLEEMDPEDLLSLTDEEADELARAT